MTSVGKLWELAIDPANEKRLEALDRLKEKLWEKGAYTESTGVHQELRNQMKLQDQITDWQVESAYLALRYVWLSDFELAADVIAEVETTIRESANLEALGQLVLAKGLVHEQRHETMKAIQCLEESLACYVELEDDFWAIYVREKILGILKDQEDWDGCAEVSLAIIELREKSGEVEQVASLHADTARYFKEAGRLEEARKHYRLALSIHRFLGMRAASLADMRLLAEVESVSGHYEDAVKLFTEVIQASKEAVGREEAARAMWSLASHNMRIGNVAKANAQFVQARGILKALGIQPS